MKALLLLLFLSITTYVSCQDSTSQIYSVVQQMPVYPGGEDSMWWFINTHVKYPDSAIAHNVEGKLVMGFVVNQDGSISDVMIKRGLTADIDSEGMRVVRLFPNFNPGMQDGKAVRVSYTLPISFKLQANPADTIKKPKVIEHMPEFPGGEMAMMQLIQKNIQYPDDARENEIQGRVVIGFIVNEDGSLSDFQVKHSVCPSLDSEAIRVIKLLPKFKPGDQLGKPVKVQFALPIKFALATGYVNGIGHPAGPPPEVVPATHPLAWENAVDSVDTKPQFPGGAKAMSEFLDKNIKYPVDAYQLNIQGKVVVGFIVNEDGHLSDFAFTYKDYMSLNKEAMRVAKLLPDFKPAIKNGKPVKTLYKLPIIFRK